MITASIVVYKNRAEDIRNVIKCISNSIVGKIYIIDNSPTDTLRHIACSESDKVEYIFGQGNVGYGAGNNIAIRKSIAKGSKYHIVINPDIDFETKVINELFQFMESQKDIGLIMPNVMCPNGDIQPLCKLLPTPFDILRRRFLPEKYMKRHNDKYQMLATGYNKIRNVPCLSGCFMFVRVDTLAKSGIFDERFFMYFEDNDLIRRIHHVSKTVYYPYVSITHNHASEHRHNNHLLWLSINSAIKYFNKWGWFFDSERRKVNRSAFSDNNILC